MSDQRSADPSLDEEIKAMHDAEPCPPESRCEICWPETNRDKALRREVVIVANGRLQEMREQAIRFEGVGEGTYHWHWAAVINELLARREGKL